MGNGEVLPRKFSLSRECGELGMAAEVAMHCSAIAVELHQEFEASSCASSCVSWRGARPHLQFTWA